MRKILVMKPLAFVFVLICLSYSGFCQQQSTDIDSTISIIVCPVEISAEFPGGYSSLFKFIKKNLKYPKQICVKGKVYVKFIVNENGSLSDFEIAKGLNEECDKNAIDVLKKMPKWIPGKVNGKVAKTRMIIPIAYTLSQ